MTAERAPLPPLPYGWREIRAKLQLAQHQLYARLGLKGKTENGLFLPLNPTRADKRPGSFVIYTDATRAGGFVEYADVGTPRGDVIDLVAYVNRFQAKIDAYWWALDFLNLDRHGRAETPRTRARAAEERRLAELARMRSEREALAEKDGKAAKAFTWWRNCKQAAGTPVETYLSTARGVPLDALGGVPAALRYNDWEVSDRSTGEVFERHAMVSAMTAYGRGVRGVHRTYLTPDGLAKDPAFDNAKMMWGDCSGAAIRLSKGASKLSPERAAAEGVTGETLALAEGIEKGLFAACVMRDWRVWAAGSLSLMGLLDWPPSVSRVLLIFDNDTSPTAIEAAARVEAGWREMAVAGAGRTVAAWKPPAGFKDIDDWALSVMGRA